MTFDHPKKWFEANDGDETDEFVGIKHIPNGSPLSKMGANFLNRTFRKLFIANTGIGWKVEANCPTCPTCFPLEPDHHF